MGRYSKAIAALVSAVVAFLGTQYADIDSAALEGAILTIVTTVAVVLSPANGSTT